MTITFDSACPGRGSSIIREKNLGATKTLIGKQNYWENFCKSTTKGPKPRPISQPTKKIIYNITQYIYNQPKPTAEPLRL